MLFELNDAYLHECQRLQLHLHALFAFGGCGSSPLRTTPWQGQAKGTEFDCSAGKTSKTTRSMLYGLYEVQASGFQYSVCPGIRAHTHTHSPWLVASSCPSLRCMVHLVSLLQCALDVSADWPPVTKSSDHLASSLRMDTT